MRSAVSGAAITGAAQAIKVIVQMAMTIVLSRMLSPDDFGVVAMVTPVVAFVIIFQDLGFQQALVQAREITPEQISRMFWMNLGVSGIIALALVVVGPAVGWFYHDARASLLTTAYAIPLLIEALSSQHMGLLNRDMRFRAMAAIDISAAIMILLSAIVSARLFHNYWALWISTTCGMLTTTSLAWALSGWKPRNPKIKASVRSLMSFGLNLAGFNILNFISRNLDNIIVAKLYGAVSLGYYDRAYKLLMAPLTNVNAPLSRVALPMLGKLQDEHGAYRTGFLVAALSVSFVCIPGTTAVGAVADVFVPGLLGERWASAAPIFAWLAVSGVNQPLGNATGWLFISQHRTKEMLHWGIVSALLTLLSFAVGAHWGTVGVAAGYALGTFFVRMPILIYWVGRSGPVSIRDLVKLQWPWIVSGALSVGLVRLALAKWALAAPEAVLLSLMISYALAAGCVFLVKDFRQLAFSSLGKILPRGRLRPVALPDDSLGL
jgi:polysaccharide transporter, PST family